MGRRAGIVAALLAVLALVALVAIPRVVESAVADALTEELSDDFPPPAVITVDVDAGSLLGLLGGRVSGVFVDVAGWSVEVAGGPLAVDAVNLELRDLEVDPSSALAGSLEEVEVGQGRFLAAVSAGAFTDLVRAAVESERPDLGPVEVDVAGANLVVTATGPDGQPATVEVRPILVEGRVVLAPLGVRDDDPARAVAEAIAGVGADLPALPLGLTFDELVVSAGGAALRGEFSDRVLNLR